MAANKRKDRPDAHKGESEEAQRARKRRSVAIALALAALAILFYAMTMVRLGGNVMNRPM